MLFQTTEFVEFATAAIENQRTPLELCPWQMGRLRHLPTDSPPTLAKGSPGGNESSVPPSSVLAETQLPASQKQPWMLAGLWGWKDVTYRQVIEGRCCQCRGVAGRPGTTVPQPQLPGVAGRPKAD